ncbi:glycoside hydrolase [Geofilum rubicundum]|uniref:Putative xylanase n=1 Tax=Geofilum rubicundum JCM 15548 TaxID=1236989 RepID=A0A0E9LRY6_9BACT|nr:glycoside hydrolase [Geofilum rubicundum]GAO28053.1 putative xylanase [Geofilum rubicundum JCM 15548]
MRKKTLLYFVIGWLSMTVYSQTAVHINVAEQHQTIRGIGASDAWNFDPVGKHWSETVKEDIALKLFSQEVDANGHPLGIGLSRWRFNVGGGSAEQGEASNIDQPERRAESFLNADGTYNWEKQSGQQWFLNKAKTHGVDHLVAFVNSPPRFYTKNGRANADDHGGTTNLKAEHFDDYATFLTEVLAHFDNQGLTFSQVSPVNEPQYPWLSGQEGTPWTNQEIAQITGLLNQSILDKGLDTQILLAEAESYRVLYQNNTSYTNRDDQINAFFNPASTHYLGHHSQVLKGIAGHGYWTDTSDEEIISVRQAVAQKAAEQGIELYQTEYCLLSNDYDNYLSNSIFLAKMVHAELAIANASVYDFWTAIERERWSQKNRFYLIRLRPNGGDYVDLENGGTISADKNLWALGNFSYFIRPGYQRISTNNTENLSGLMSSAYLAPDQSEIIVVHVNWGNAVTEMDHLFYALPEGKKIKQITPYVTDATNNLQQKAAINSGDSYTISAKSVTTMVVELEASNGSVEDPVASQQQLLTGEKENEAIVYHDFLEWTIADANKIPSWYLQQDNGTYTDWVANPDQSGINGTATSLVTETQSPVDWWGNFLAFRLETPVTITEENRFLHILHYREHNNYGWSFQINTDAPYEDAGTYLGTLRFDGDNASDNTWEDVVIDLQHLIETGTPLEKILMIVDKAWESEKNSAPSKYYFDEIVLSASPFSRTSVTAIPGAVSTSSGLNVWQSAPLQISVSGLNMKQIDLFDISGRKVLSGKNLNNTPTYNLHMPATGLYIIKVRTTEGGILTEKVLVK